jgi:hypothetical protein
MGKQRMNKGWVFLLIFLMAVGVLILYTKLSFTGFVTYIPGGAVSSYSLVDGTFDGTKVDTTEPPAVVVDISNNYTNGTYLSPLISAPDNIEVAWNTFTPNITTPTGAIVLIFKNLPDTSVASSISL